MEGLRIKLFTETYDASFVDADGAALEHAAERVILEVPQAMIVHIRSISGPVTCQLKDHR
jgi:hypothetical protein